MNLKWKSLLLTALLSAIALLGTACGSSSKELKALQGRWVDVNSNATLDFSGNRMTFGLSVPEVFKVKVENGQVVNAESGEYGFGLVGSLDITADGALRAEEQILDAEGHSFYFVREADKAALLEIKDNSRDLPKEIHSTEIEEFSLNFKKTSGDEYGLGDSWPAGQYEWEIEREEDGSYEMELYCVGDSYIAMRFEARVDKEYVDGLAQLIQEMELPGLNGYSRSNAVDRPGYSLRVEYTDGEELWIKAAGDAANSCVFDLPRLMEYAKKQDIFTF